MNIPTLKLTVTGVIGTAGAALATFLGGWSSDLITLILFMGIDLITGLIVAGVFHTSKKTTGGAIESNSMFKGLVKKFAMILVVAMLYRIDILFGISFLRTAANRGYGFVNNLTRRGLWQQQ